MQALDGLAFAPVTYFAGENGSGKSTILEAIALAAGLNAEGGSRLLKHRFGPKGLFVLDEPEAALSPSRQLALLARMHELVEEGSQFIIATHAAIVLAYPDATIYQLTAEGIASVAYDETEHVRLTRDFLADRDAFLDKLFAPSE